MSKKLDRRDKPGRKRASGSAVAHELRLRRFVEAYLANGGNSTSAAIQAGATVKSAHVMGCRWLKEVKESGLLEQRQKQLLERLELKTERVIRKLVVIADAELSMFLGPKGNILPPSDWPAEVRGAVQSLKWGKFGPEIKLHDVNSAIEKAMKHLGLFKEDNKQKGDAIAALLAKVAENNAGIRIPGA